MKKRTNPSKYIPLLKHQQSLSLFYTHQFYLLCNMQVRNNSRAWTLNDFSISDFTTLAIKDAGKIQLAINCSLPHIALTWTEGS